MGVFFSDYFDIDESIIEEYGAVNISLINDLPLFIDPFLLFNSPNEEYQRIHNNIIQYLLFLHEQAQRYPYLDSGMMKAWFRFPEVKQTWLGFSLSGNSGRGMGDDFARGLYEGLNSTFKDFSNLNGAESLHLEKLCLINPGVGRDKISDFTTNFVKEYLLEYTQAFAQKYISSDQRKTVVIQKAYFDWCKHVWARKSYDLPFCQNDYVLLTPKDILTCDDTFINRKDMLRSIQLIAPSIPDDELRFELNQYFQSVLSNEKRPKKKEIELAAELFVRSHPEIIDHYIKHKEEHKITATSISKARVQETEQVYIRQVSELRSILAETTEFYDIIPDAYDETMKRVMFLKHVIEDKDGYRVFYEKDKPVNRESMLQIMFLLTWYNTPLDVNREVNNGRGPADFKISYGRKNAMLVEFKLASNSKLRQNMEKQVEVYKLASDTERAVKVIMYFTESEEKKVISLLNELNLSEGSDVVVINARKDDKISASNIK